MLVIIPMHGVTTKSKQLGSRCTNINESGVCIPIIQSMYTYNESTTCTPIGSSHAEPRKNIGDIARSPRQSDR